MDPWYNSVVPTILVRERGSYTDVVINYNFHTLGDLVLQLQRSFSTQSHVIAIIKEDFTRIEKDVDLRLLFPGERLEVVFANKFYWVVTSEQRREWSQEFLTTVRDLSGKMTGDQARAIFTMSMLTIQELAVIWDLADVDKDSCLNFLEYMLARFLIFARRQNQTLLNPLPQSLLDSLTSSKSQISANSPVPALLDFPKHKKKRPTSAKIERQSTVSHMPYDKEKSEKGKNTRSSPKRPVSNKLQRDRDKKANTLPLPEESPWSISKGKWIVYSKAFSQHNDGGYITGSIALDLFSRSGIDRRTLAQVWALASINKGGALDAFEFKIAMHLISNLLCGIELPPTLPQELIDSAKSQKISRSTSTPAISGDMTHVPPVDQHYSPTSHNTYAQLWPFTPVGAPKPASSSGSGIPANSFNLLQGPWLPPNNNVPPISTPNSPVPKFVVHAEAEIGSVLRIDPNSIQRTTVIGAGSFARVWCGTWNGEVVAIKDISYRSETEIEMWRKEVQLLLKLQHANYLVRIKGYCTSQNFLTIVMEFMDGGSLYDIIHKQQNKVSWNMLHKLRILCHIAKAIESVHQENIIHRDIKSMNILLDRSGTAKLTDLGCSRLVRMETMTKGVGSPLWMAPEVAKGLSYSFPCDIFSFGVVCFEVLNESLPDYDMPSQQAIIPPDCNGSIIIKECTRINPERRPTATKLVSAMDNLQVSFTVSAARAMISNPTVNVNEWPKLDDVTSWYNIFLKFDHDKFDALLKAGLNNQKM